MQTNKINNLLFEDLDSTLKENIAAREKRLTSNLSLLYYFHTETVVVNSV
jgi:hypothetical protein